MCDDIDCPNDGFRPSLDDARPVTILDVALAHGARQDAAGAISGAEFERLGLPMLGGCQGCAASIAAYNAYPSKTGYLQCKDCIGELGFATVAEFDSFDPQ